MMTEEENRTDADLLKRFSSEGDSLAFSALVKRHSSMVYSASLRVISSHHDAEEITQKVFLQLAKEAGKLANRPSVAGWLHTVVRHTSINMLKARKIRSRKEQEAMDETDPLLPDSGVACKFREGLDEAVQKLPERYRQPLILFHLEGASLHEVSGRLSLNSNTVKTRLARAREILRQSLNRGGVGVTSAGAVVALLAAEAKAATVPASLDAILLNQSFTSGASLSESALQVAEHASSAGGNFLTSQVTQLYLIIKTKMTIGAVIIAFALLGTAAVMTVAHFKSISERDAANGVSIESPRRSARPTGSHARSGESIGDALPQLFLVTSMSAFEELVKSVCFIEDDQDRLEGIRNKLGMGLSEAAYQNALQRYGYRISPDHFFEELVSAFIVDSPLKAVEWTGKIPKSIDGDNFVMGALSLWLQNDETAARSYILESIDFDEEMTLTLDAALKQYRKYHSRERIDRVLKKGMAITDMTEWLALTSEPLTHLGEIDPKAAVDYAFEWTKTGNMQPIGLFIKYSGDWAAQDPDAALAWALQIEDEKIKGAVLLGVVPAWRLKHPVADLDLGGISDEDHQEIVHRVLLNIGASDPAAGIDYAFKHIEDRKLRQNALNEVISNWASKAPDEALRWVEKLPESDAYLRDRSLEIISEVKAATNFAEGSGLALQITDQEVRDEALLRIIRVNLKDNLQKSMGIIPDISKVSYKYFVIWSSNLSGKGDEAANALRGWIRQADKAGKIDYSGWVEIERDGLNSEEVRQMKDEAIEGLVESVRHGEESDFELIEIR